MGIQLLAAVRPWNPLSTPLEPDDIPKERTGNRQNDLKIILNINSVTSSGFSDISNFEGSCYIQIKNPKYPQNCYAIYHWTVKYCPDYGPYYMGHIGLSYPH